MAVTLAPDPAETEDPTLPPKPVAPKPPVAPGAPAAPVAAAPAPTVAAAPMAAPMTAPAPTVAAPAAPVNRIQLATQAFDTIQKQREPGDQLAREAVTSQAAGLGQLGSGQWRTALMNEDAKRRASLDLQRDELINKATEGSIADASTAYQQALSGSQLALAGELGRGNLDVSKGSLDLAKEGQKTSTALEKERLDLAREGQTGSLDLQKAALELDEKVRTGQMTLAERDQALRELQSGEQLDLQKAALALDEKVRTGQMTLAERDQALRELQSGEQLDLQKAALALDEKVRTGQMTLAERDQALRELQSAEQIKLATAGVTGRIDTGEVDEDGNPIYEDTFAAKTATSEQAYRDKVLELDELVRTGQLSLAEKDQALRELAQSQGNAREGERLALAKEELAQRASQFGASQEQQLALATLADKTANRQIDVSSAHGQNALLLELARIMGGPSGNVSPDFLRSLARAMGVELPGTGAGSPPTSAPGGTTPGSGVEEAE